MGDMNRGGGSYNCWPEWPLVTPWVCGLMTSSARAYSCPVQRAPGPLFCRDQRCLAVLTRMRGTVVQQLWRARVGNLF